jgi:hypothetical protein
MRRHSSARIQESSSFFRKESKADNTLSTLSGEFTKAERRLNAVNFSKLRHRNPNSETETEFKD